MRRISGLAALAVVAVGVTALQPAGASASGSASSVGTRAAAVTALAQHPGAALAAPGQDFRAVSTLTDANGTTHVRVDRTYRGLQVLGGDMVVHQSRTGRW